MLTAVLHKYLPLDHLTFFYTHSAGPDSEEIRDRAHRRASATRNPHLDHKEEAVDVPVGIICFEKKPG